MMEMRVSPTHHAIRIEEIALTADFQMKLHEERERAREECERLREERKAEQEIAAQREMLEKERASRERHCCAKGQRERCWDSCACREADLD